MPADLLPPGTLIADRFEVGEHIGSGGYGEVYRGTQLSVERPVALKIVHLHLRERADVEARFRREARLASRLRHPHIVRVIDFGAADSGELFLVMELIDGPTLKDVLAARPRLELGEALGLVGAIAGALAHAHAAGVVHRDLKPGNVIVDAARGKPMHPVVIDFGLVKAFREEDEEGTTVTQSNVMIGTPAYMSPECVLGEPIDGASDVYALGVMAWEMLGGRRPFGGRSAMEAATQRVAGAAPSLRDAAPTIDPEVASWVARMLERNAAARPTAAEVASWATAFGAVGAVAAPPSSAPQTDETLLPTRGPGVSGPPASPSPAGASNLRSRLDRADAGRVLDSRRRAPSAGARNRPLAAAVVVAAILAVLSWTILHPGDGHLDASSDLTAAEVARPEPPEPERSAAPGREGGDLPGPAPEGSVDAPDIPEAAGPVAMGAPRSAPTATEVDDPGEDLAAAPVTEPAPSEPDSDRRSRRSADDGERNQEEGAEDRNDDRMGVLTVNIDPFGDVFVDGERAGEAPLTGYRLRPGSYTITTRHRDDEQRERVRVRAGEEMSLTHIFRRPTALDAVDRGTTP